nr:MAG TPA_asm: hypothetical protein [Caudoviricetes sp.]
MTAKWYVFVRSRKRAQTIFVMSRNCSCAAHILLTSTKCSYVVLAMISSLLLFQRRPGAVEEKLNNGADGLIGDGPRDEFAPLAGVEGHAEHLRHPRLAFCAALGALNLVLCLLDQVKHGALDSGAVAQPDAAQGVKDKAAQHEHEARRGGNDAQNVTDCCHVLLSSLFFEICNAVVCHLHLLFQHRDALGEVVVCPNFPGQLVQLSVGNGLLFFQLGVHVLSGPAVRDKHADQAQAASDECYDDSVAHAPSRRRVRPFLRMILG